MKDPSADKAIGRTLKENFSAESITQKLRLMLQRFPISVTFLVLLAGTQFLVSIGAVIDDRVIIFLAIGATIGIAATLWLEDIVNYRKQILIICAAVLLWGVYCIFLSVDGAEFSLRHSLSKNLELWAIGAFSFLAIFFICFLKKGKENAFWNFASRTLVQFCLAAIFGSIIFLGLCGAFAATNALLGDDIFVSWVYGNVAIFCFVLFAPLYFIANIPDKTAKYDEDIYQNKIGAILGQYILTPLAAIYAVILYAYLFKIIITWELPQGLVSRLVSALACCGLLIITLLYPTRQLGKNEAVNAMSRWFGVIILPLIVLMSIGIFRRLSDYGVTIARLYLLLVNLWFYGIYAYIFITKARRIKWILISAAAIFLIISVGPWSIPNVTKYVLTVQVEKYLGGQKISVSDIRNPRVFELSQALDDNENKYIILSTINYLNDIYGNKSVAHFLDSDSAKQNFADSMEVLPSSKKKESAILYYDHDIDNERYHLKEYNSFIRIYCRSDRNPKNCYVDKNQLVIDITQDNRKIYVPIREIAQHSIKRGLETKNGDHIFQGDNYTVVIDRFTGTYNERDDIITVDSFFGYLFYNK
jgi:hypothetical protein